MLTIFCFPRISRLLSGLLGLVVGLAAAPVVAQGDGLTATPDGRYRVGMNGPQLTLVDNAQFRTLIGNSTTGFYWGSTLRSSIRMEPQHYGANLIIVLSNDSDQPKPLGNFTIDGIRLPSSMKQWVFFQDTSVRTIPDYTWYNFWVYPKDLYSPVQVIGDDRHTLGISMLYPIVEYDHDVEVQLRGVNETSAAGGPPHWKVQFTLRGDLPRGATRTYTIAIRATTADRSFLYTLTPYRDYFRSQFGPVHYTRDIRPITGMSLATSPSVGPSNPQGWAPSNFRPDLIGWAPTVTQLLMRRNLGFRRIMLWVPSGVFPVGSPLNFPWRFMTPINDYPLARSTFSEFRRLRAGGVDLGFWWGNTAALMRGWANPTWEPFDPNNSEHVTLAYAELDKAVNEGGAKMIGLDAFKQRSAANMHKWLWMLRERAPDVKFITENGAPDYIHNLSPTFHEAGLIRNPHILADFLNPGHETWAAIGSTAESRSDNYRNPTNAEFIREARRVADLGFVPLLYALPPMPTIKAAETWTRTVPRDLQMPAQSNRLVNQPGLRR